MKRAVARPAAPGPTSPSCSGPTPCAEAPHRAWPIPARIDDVAAGRGRVLFVGDAAAAADPMTGEGIGQALLTGALAAEAIVAAGAVDADRWRARRATRARCARELVADHRMSPGAQPGAARTARGAGAAIRLGRRSRRGPAATSPAGCSRTSPGPSRSPPAAGTATFLARSGAYA